MLISDKFKVDRKERTSQKVVSRVWREKPLPDNRIKLEGELPVIGI